MGRLRFSFALLTMPVMNRPRGLGLTATLMAVCSAFDWTIPNYANIPHPLRVLAIDVVLIGIEYVFIWFYWMGKNWARTAVLIFSVFQIFGLRMWNTASPSASYATTPVHVLLIAKALLSVALSYWLNTRPAVEFFKRNKPVSTPSASS